LHVPLLTMPKGTQCRKAQGVAFASNSPLNNNELHFEGTQYIKEYLSSGDKVRAFYKYHIHTDSIAPWYEITDQHPQFRQGKKT